MSERQETFSSPNDQELVKWSPHQIKALRDYLGLTQRQMADELAVRQQTVSEWETGLHSPHRSTKKALTMVAERAGFVYDVSAQSDTPNPQTEQEEPETDTAADA